MTKEMRSLFWPKMLALFAPTILIVASAASPTEAERAAAFDTFIAAIERGLDGVEHEPVPPPRLVEPPPGVLDAVAHIAVPTTNFIMQVGPPEDPVLRKLWDNVEPSAPAG